MWIEGERSFHLGARADLLPDDKEIAAHWASSHIHPNLAHSYVVGRFVESDKGNLNRQLLSLDGIQLAKPTLQNAPMNMNHNARRVVGSYIATEMMFPTQESADDESVLNPFLEALGVVWKSYFPEEYRDIAKAHAEGSLYFSMETVPERVQCQGCMEEFAYAGPQSATYCSHINDREADRLLINPHFVGGALVIPPAKPGWANAAIKSLASQEIEHLEAQGESEFSHLTPNEWQGLMSEIIQIAGKP